MIHPNAGGVAKDRKAADNAAVRAVFIIGPDKRIKLMIVYPMSTGRDFNEVTARTRLAPAYRQAQRGDAGQLEERRGRDHCAVGVRRRRAQKIPQRLEGTETVSADRAAAARLKAGIPLR